LLRDLALGLSRDAGHVFVLTDSGGDVLWVDGEPGLVEQASTLGLAPGVRWADWAEVRGFGDAASTAERWACWASPVFDPRAEDLLGVLAVCGPAGTRDTLLLVRAVARLAEELVLRDPLRTPLDDEAGVAANPDGVHLRVLGPGLPVAEVAGATVALTPRRADILFLLAQHPDGLSADALAQELYGDTGNPLTVRVEVHRIRALLGDRLASAPYRFVVPVTTDADIVLRLVARGRSEEAVLRYTGPAAAPQRVPGHRTAQGRTAPDRARGRTGGRRRRPGPVVRPRRRRGGRRGARPLRGRVVAPGPGEAVRPGRLAQLELDAAPAACNSHATSPTGHWAHG